MHVLTIDFHSEESRFDRAFFERMAKQIEHISPKLREFVQEEHPVVREAHLAGPRDVPSADQAGIEYRVVRRSKLALYYERTACEHPSWPNAFLNP